MSNTESNGLKKYLVGISSLLVVQIAAAFYWGGEMTSRMGHAERDISRVEVRVTHIEHTKHRD
ncbi:hypothetical protein LCGC14_2101420 [marine sediment metagenome]|uniref:Uncharacterized protein n=1 Tax=marine sediment metagenome TaxID=412755 RepID=A0A0F9EA06_9ZZZZ